MHLSFARVLDRRALALTVGLLCGLVVARPCAAQESAAQQYFTDVVLTNQYGEEMRFYSDVLQGKVVVINAFFTTCEGVCPVINGKLAELQERLGDRLGSEIFFVSITVDPLTDTPARLQAYAEKVGARPGWIFLTGPKENVDSALSKLGQYVEDKEAHSSIVLVGNEPTGLWKKVFGLGKTAELLKIVEGVLHDQG
jgi:protein SCO1/2